MLLSSSFFLYLSVHESFLLGLWWVFYFIFYLDIYNLARLHLDGFSFTMSLIPRKIIYGNIFLCCLVSWTEFNQFRQVSKEGRLNNPIQPYGCMRFDLGNLHLEIKACTNQYTTTRCFNFSLMEKRFFSYCLSLFCRFSLTYPITVFFSFP